jgi:hypothetical protein
MIIRWGCTVCHKWSLCKGRLVSLPQSYSYSCTSFHPFFGRGICSGMYYTRQNSNVILLFVPIGIQHRCKESSFHEQLSSSVCGKRNIYTLLLGSIVLHVIWSKQWIKSFLYFQVSILDDQFEDHGTCKIRSQITVLKTVQIIFFIVALQPTLSLVLLCIEVS